MDDDEADELYARSVAARPIDWLIIGMDFARNISESVTTLIRTTETLLIGHANHQIDQHIFMDEARRQIEQMTNDPQE